jgi:uncharacterized protein (DUF427 family)
MLNRWLREFVPGRVGMTVVAKDDYCGAVSIAPYIRREILETLMSKVVKIPGPDHPITVTRNTKRVVVKVGGQVIADTRAALVLKEASYPPVQYIPRQDVDMSKLERTDHATYCPYKGDCSYYSIPSGGAKTVNAVWSYEAPYESVTIIKDHLAFYPDRVELTESS